MKTLKTSDSHQASTSQWQRNKHILQDASMANAQQVIESGDVLHYRQELERLHKEWEIKEIEQGIRVGIRAGDENRRVDEDDDDEFDSDDREFLNDPELDAELRSIHERRAEAARQTFQQQQQMLSRGHGHYDEMDEKDFLKMAVETEFVVCHFYLDGWERCQILDNHFARIAKTEIETRFVKINASKANFLSAKWRIRTLPSICILINGRLNHKMIGFDEMGGSDEFTTLQLHRALAKHGVVKDVNGTRKVIGARTQTLA